MDEAEISRIISGIVNLKVGSKSGHIGNNILDKKSEKLSTLTSSENQPKISNYFQKSKSYCNINMKEKKNNISVVDLISDSENEESKLSKIEDSIDECPSICIDENVKEIKSINNNSRENTSFISGNFHSKDLFESFDDTTSRLKNISCVKSTVVSSKEGHNLASNSPVPCFQLFDSSSFLSDFSPCSSTPCGNQKKYNVDNSVHMEDKLCDLDFDLSNLTLDTKSHIKPSLNNNAKSDSAFECSNTSLNSDVKDNTVPDNLRVTTTNNCQDNFDRLDNFESPKIATLAERLKKKFGGKMDRVIDKL